jgi:UDP-N-acetylglucosamine 4-epimerase
MSSPQTWLVTGGAGFIGSHLVEALLRAGHNVRALDNLSTGKTQNIAPFKSSDRFLFIEGDVCDPATCRKAVEGANVVLHQAALGSVPLSMLEPEKTHAANVTGFLNMLVAARDAGAKRFVYASSSAVYGDEPSLPKVEERIGHPLSPYAASKWMDEIYADVFGRCYGMETVGLRYFNVFGPRQDPAGAYAAVIPAWIAALIRNEPVRINGDGETSRDFCHVANVVQANIAAGSTTNRDALNQAYNIAVGGKTTLNELFALLKNGLAKRFPRVQNAAPIYQDFRQGDVRHSLANISKAQRLLGYKPTHSVAQGLDEALNWYVETL